MPQRSPPLKAAAFVLPSSGIGLLTLNSRVPGGHVVDEDGCLIARKGRKNVRLDSSDETGMRKLFDELTAVDHIFSNGRSVAATHSQFQSAALATSVAGASH